MRLLEIIDTTLDYWMSEKGNCLPQVIPQDMAAGKTEDGWNYWKPVRSSVSLAQLVELEEQFGVRFSPQYKLLLQHKHFMQLRVGEVSFFNTPASDGKAVLESVYDVSGARISFSGKGSFHLPIIVIGGSGASRHAKRIMRVNVLFIFGIMSARTFSSFLQ